MTDPAIQVQGVVKRYGEVVALDGIDLAVPAGTVLGLLGPNGAGKTTAVRVLTTITRPDAGKASVLGIDVTERPAAVRAVIGLAGQYAAVDENLTARENLQLMGRLTHLSKPVIRSRSAELLETFDLVHAADRALKTYSGGMRRRLDLAAALLHRPPVLFLDEPTTGLDPRSRKDLWGVIENLVALGTTVLLTTQYLEEADRLADRIAVIDEGRVIAEGTSDELKARLGATVIELRLADEASAAQARQLLTSVMANEPEQEGSRVFLRVDDGPSALTAVVRALDAEGVVLAGLALREPSLDDVFLSLTGHRAEVSGGDDPDADDEPGAEAVLTGRNRS